MAAASKKKSTKENDEVKDNAKNAESVFERKAAEPEVQM